MPLQFQWPDLETSLAAFEKEYRYLWKLQGKPVTQDALDNIQKYIFKCWRHENDYHIVGSNRAMMIYGWEPNLNLLYIADLWVEPPFRRQRLASNLVQFAIDLQRRQNPKALTLAYVLKNNDPAIAFFQKMGFKTKAGSEDETGCEMYI